MAEAAAEEHERGLPLAVHRRQVGLHERGLARPVQVGDVLAGRLDPARHEARCSDAAARDGGLDHVVARRRLPRRAGRDPRRRHGRDARGREIGEIGLVAVPAQDRLGVDERGLAGDRRRPGEEPPAPGDVAPRVDHDDEGERRPVDAGVVPHGHGRREPRRRRGVPEQRPAGVEVERLRARGEGDRAAGSAHGSPSATRQGATTGASAAAGSTGAASRSFRSAASAWRGEWAPNVATRTVPPIASEHAVRTALTTAM